MQGPLEGRYEVRCGQARGNDSFLFHLVLEGSGLRQAAHIVKEKRRGEGREETSGWATELCWRRPPFPPLPLSPSFLPLFSPPLPPQQQEGFPPLPVDGKHPKRAPFAILRCFAFSSSSLLSGAKLGRRCTSDADFRQVF